MFETVLQGVILGLLLSSLLGPIFFVLIETSIREGFKSALFLNLGVFASDAVCVILAYYGTSGIVEDISHNTYFYIIGGLIFISFGGTKLFKLYRDNKDAEVKAKQIDLTQFKEKGFFVLFSKGFLLNIVNPSLILFWLGAMAFALSSFPDDTSSVTWYFTGTLLTVLVVDILKVYVARKLKRFLSEKFMFWLNLSVGILFVIVGVSLMIRPVF
jgi:threonine/homoserine/homoserine lactone efflux protein